MTRRTCLSILWCLGYFIPAQSQQEASCRAKASHINDLTVGFVMYTETDCMKSLVPMVYDGDKMVKSRVRVVTITQISDAQTVSVLEYRYSPKGLLQRISKFDSSGKLAITDSIIYGPNGHPVKWTGTTGGQQCYTDTVIYDENKRASVIKRIYPDTVSLFTSFEYGDFPGKMRITGNSHAGQAINLFYFDSECRLLHLQFSDGRGDHNSDEFYLYDDNITERHYYERSNGRLFHSVTKQEYNGAGNTSKTEEWEEKKLISTERYYYTAGGLLRKITSSAAGKKTTRVYEYQYY